MAKCSSLAPGFMIRLIAGRSADTECVAPRHNHRGRRDGYVYPTEGALDRQRLTALHGALVHIARCGGPVEGFRQGPRSTAGAITP